MNILSGIQLSGKRREVVAKTSIVSAMVNVGTAASILSIKAAIEGKNDLVVRRALRESIEEIRRAALAVQRSGAAQELTLTNKNVAVLESLGQLIRDGAIGVVTSTLKWVGRALYLGVRYAIVPLARAIAFGAGLLFKALAVPEISIPLALAAVGYFVYKRYNKTEAPEPKAPVAEPVGASTVNAAVIPETASRNVKANNPGNVRYAGQLGATGTAGAFAAFDTQENGLYAVAKQLQLYSARDKLNTVEGIVGKYAPASENDTERYIAFMTKRLGVKRDTPLDLKDPAVAEALLRGILIQESGHNLPYTDQQYADAVRRSIAYRKETYERAASSLLIPTTGVLTSPFGLRTSPKPGASTYHQGVDIAAAQGTPVYAANSGVVVKAGPASGYGTLLSIAGDSVTTRYGHMRKLFSKEGERVTIGQQIGEMGNEGVSTGPHLHFEVIPITATRPVDPAGYLPGLAGAKQQSEVAQVTPQSKPTATNYINVDGTLIRLDS